MDKKEFYDKIKRNISIVEYAASIGYTPIRVGRYYTLKEHDSVRIDIEKNCFWQNSTGESGSIIDFALTFTTYSMKDVLEQFELILNGTIGFQTHIMQDELPKFGNTVKDFKLPEAANNIRNIYAYLCNRCIDKRVFTEFMKRHLLYQDTHNNCVFVAYDNDGKAAYAMLRGTNTYKTFKGDVPGCDYGCAFAVYNNSDTLVVCESPIEIMSLMSIFLTKNIAMQTYDYISLSGIFKHEALFKRVEKNTYQRIILALNNDGPGKMVTKELYEKLENVGCNVKVAFPKAPDWNDQLCLMKGRKE